MTVYLVDLADYEAERERIIAEFNTKVGQIESQISALNTEIVDLEGQISNWTNKINTIEPQVNTLEQKYYDLQNTWSTVSDILGIPYRADGSWNPWPDELDDAQIRVFALPIDIDRDGIQELRNNARIEYEYCANWWQIGRPEITTGYYNNWNDALKAEVSKFKAIVDAKFSELSGARNDLTFYKDQRLAAESSLESKTRHMHDLQLAKEAAETEKLDALSDWESDYTAAQERKRIELDSIARDITLGYPLIDADSARDIAESAYNDALARGFAWLSDAITLAMGFAKDWYNTNIYPHWTTEAINCPSCEAKLEITKSDIAGHNVDIYCPYCKAYCC